MEALVALVTTVVAGLLLSAVAEVVARLKRSRRAEDETAPTLEDRLSNLGQLMRSSALVLEEVHAEIQARIALAEKAKRDADDAERLARLNEAQRLAIARLVRAELSSEVSRGSRRSFWQGFALNLLFFVLGGVVSVATTLWVDK